MKRQNHQKGESVDRTYHVQPREGALRSSQRAGAAGERGLPGSPSTNHLLGRFFREAQGGGIAFSGQMSWRRIKSVFEICIPRADGGGCVASAGGWVFVAWAGCATV